MKAVLLERFGGSENLHFTETQDPIPGPGEILVRVRACALNHLDLWVRQGIPAYKIQLPHIPGSDIAGEAVSGDFTQALKSLCRGGMLVTCGSTSGPKVELDMRYVFSRELRVCGAMLGTFSDFWQMLSAVEAGKLKPVVDSVFPLAQARQAQDYLFSGRQFGKVILQS